MESENASGLQMLREPSLEGLSVLVNPDKPTLDIVFVHGFTGHPERTWTHKGEVPEDRYRQDNDYERPPKFRKIISSASFHHSRIGVRKATYWPRDLVPITVPNARVLTHGYDTHIRHWVGSAASKSTAYDIAWDFLISLETARRSEPSRPLLFIAHSLGGIVVKEALRRSRGCKINQSHLRRIYESTSGVVFFGTPHGGADPRGPIQRIAEKCIRAAGFSVNEQIVNSLLPSSERLRELRDEFGPMARQKNWTIYSFQEQYGIKALNGNKVVEDTASCLNDPEIEVTQHIASNHMDMCRFSGPDDVEYGKVVGALNRVLEATAKSPPSGVRSVLNADQRRSFLDSLRFDQSDVRHASIKTAHAKTCKWLLSKSEHRDWLDDHKISGHHGFLWIKGKPGSGKSTIMKFAFAHSKKMLTDTIVISFFFNARGAHLENSTLGMYRSLLFQLLEKVPELQNVFDVQGSTAPSKGDIYPWDIEVLKALFGRAIEQLEQRRLTCFIDALDECEEDQVRDMVAFFEDLGQLAVSSQIWFHVCFSSRHYPHITIEKGVQLILEGQEGHNQDIANYLHSELKAGHSKHVEQIRFEILERASGIFLWVVLVVQILNKEYDRGRIHALRQRFQEIPNGLDELFKDILTRDNQNPDELMLCIQWILYAKRPLKPEELYFAILSGVDPKGLTAWNPDEVTKKDIDRFILSSSKGLAEATKSKDQTIQFIHESVRDFLLKGNEFSELLLNLGSNFPGSSHERLKQCCYIYMSMDISEHLPLSTPLPAASSEKAADLRRLTSERFPFLEYAVRNVLHHADTIESNGLPQNDFIENFPLRDWIDLDNLFERYQIRRHTPNASLLYILAEKNLLNLIRIQLRRVPHVDIEGERYGFPIFAALANCDEVVVKLLVSKGVDAGLKGKNGRTPLSQAAEKGYEAVIKLLLAAEGIDVDSKDKYGRTPLWYAAANGHESVVKLFLTIKDVDADSKDKDYQTPLSLAAEKGHEAVVKLLLTTEKVNADSKDKHGQTPLLKAVKNGHETVIKLLLVTERVNADSKDNDGETPLSRAVAHGHESVVKLLLETEGVDADSKDNNGKTPLSRAAEDGYERVAKLLLETEKVDADSKDNNGRTPLSRAATSGRDSVVKLLLGTEKVDADSKDNNGKTPLSWAATNGRDSVVKLLLGTEKVDADSKDNNGKTSLSRAAVTEHESVVRLLLATGRVNADSKDKDGWTPLSRAVITGHDSVIKLLSRPVATARDSGVQRSLSFEFTSTPSVPSSNLIMLPRLVNTARDSDVQPSLSFESTSTVSVSSSMIKVLLRTEGVDVDSKDNDGWTPLSWAAMNGHESVVKLLLRTEGVDVDSKDNDGRTSLSRAATNGHESVIRLLLATERVDVNSKDNGGWTPLSWATMNGYEAVIKLLLETETVGVDSKDNDGWTPLSRATATGTRT